MKQCKKCLETKPLTQFFKDKALKDGHSNTCKVCKQKATYEWRKENPQKYNALAVRWRDKNPDKYHATEIKRAYGISIEEYNQLLIKQECKCAICGKQHDPSAKRGRLYVDHDHKGPQARSGIKTEVRGLLCHACNCALGYFKDDISLIQKAIDYLKNRA